MHRRTFNLGLAGAAASLAGCSIGPRIGGSGRTALYQSVGDKLLHYDVDLDAAALTPRSSVTLPSIVQHVWPHPSRRYLYACSSDGEPGVADSGHVHRLCALRVGADGALSPHGDPQTLSERPIHNSVDATGAYAFTCYPTPSNLTVHRINRDGALGSQITQSNSVDFGIFPHQVRATPTNRSVVMVTRGVNASPKKPELPGALQLYRFRDGQLSPLQTIQVGARGGLGYGPRHLDFHPVRPWVYVAIERQNQLHMHVRQGDTFAPEPSFIAKTTSGDYPDLPQTVLASAVFVHPNGRNVYVSNRASRTEDFNGRKVFRGGGENNIAVFSIDRVSGEPAAIQYADVQGFDPRVFSIDPSGRVLVAASQEEMWVHDGNGIRHVPAGLSVFRVAADGRLNFVRKYDVELGGQQAWWVGMMALPA
jgi:6-phosphogluconolactonase